MMSMYQVPIQHYIELNTDANETKQKKKKKY